MYGSSTANPRSRFIDELPPEDIEGIGIGSSGFSGVGWEKRGDRHGTYGSGRGSEVYGGRIFGSHTRSAGGGTAGVAARTATEHHDDQRSEEAFQVGDHISHKTFGPGVVKAVEADTFTVYFSRIGKTKKLMKGFAPVVKIST
jgi:DNA helicase-2/ATP-dependent DNA helicase PcrA